MFVWLIWAFLFLDFRFLAVHRYAIARANERGLVEVALPLPLSKFALNKGFVGCLYSDVCSADEECINDNLFGRCSSTESKSLPFDIRFGKVPSDGVFLTGLEKVLKSLWLSGFTWHDLFTQCIVRTTLFSYKLQVPMDLTVCEPHVMNRRLDGRKRSEEPIHVHKYAPPKFDDLFEESKLQREDGDKDTGENEVNSNFDSDYDLYVLEPLEPWQAVDSDQEKQEPLDFTPVINGNEISAYWTNKNDDQAESDSQIMANPIEEESILRDDDDLAQSKYLNQFLIEEFNADNQADTQRMHETGNPERVSSKISSNKEGDENKSKRVFSRRVQHRSAEENARVVDRSYISMHVNYAGEKLNESTARTFMEALSHQIDPSVNYAVESRFNVDQQEITFKIPSESVLTTDEIVDLLKNNTKIVPGLEITNVAYGTPYNHVSISELHPESNPVILTLILCSAVLVAVTLVLVIFFIQRHRLNRKTLWMDYSSNPTAVSSIQPVFYGGGASTASGADAYRDLCRHHAQSKAMEESIETFLPEQESRRRSDDSASPHTSTSSWVEEPVQSNMDISTGHAILSYMEDHLNRKGKLEAEWRTMCSYESDSAQIVEAKKDVNAPKNRYVDAMPYDRSRVKLQNPSTNGTDYINASFIVDHDPKVPVYIATQGPLINTVVDFWQMVWEQNSVVVVNLSCLIEAGVPMCQKYWPEEGSQVFDKFEVHLVSEHVWCEEYLVRSFYLKNLETSETRTISQFHYIAWPDLDTPTSSRSILEFRRKVNKSFRNKTSPIVIHCSDGCGRTGTYVLLDMILTRLSRGVKEVDVAAALEHIRDQRMDMVKTKDQFEFVLLCIAEEVQSILKVMSS